MTNNSFTALLIDIVSIQPYIFSSNKLKENIGASYIIEHRVYKGILIDVLQKQFPGEFSADWESNSVVVMESNTSCNCEIGYIGGGNALLLFRDEKKVRPFIQAFTLELLLQYPGLRTRFGKINNFELGENGFSTSREELMKEVLLNQHLHYRNVTVPKSGIVEDCRLSNDAQETDFGVNKDISHSCRSKFEAVKLSQKEINDRYATIIGDKYVFTEELDNLGQAKDKGYIAIVHIDGNNIGGLFAACKDLMSLRKLSKEVRRLGDEVMFELIDYVVKLFNEKLNKENGFELVVADDDTSEEEYSGKNKKQLPIRPLIAAGDDFTFVCEGRLGIHLAEKLVELIRTKRINGEQISVCCGVAIIKTKYPFYRAYKLAEELTAKAKKESRKIEGSSWMSFLVLSGGYSGGLEDIIQQQFKTSSGKILTIGAYRLDPVPGVDSMDELKNAMREFSSDKWPRRKLMELRDALRGSEAAQLYFVAEANVRELKLVECEENPYYKKLWINDKTPFYDIIELMEFYPKALLTP
jgi:hypothetical protein